METSINDQSGGTAAETPNINPNHQFDPNIDMNHTNEESVMLKEAAAKFGCAASSLKNNIKSGKLAATQANEKAPYMVRLSDVERFLRDTPGIVSIFHPAADKSVKEVVGQTCAAPIIAGDPQPAAPSLADDEHAAPVAGDETEPSPVTPPMEPVRTEAAMSGSSVSSDVQSEQATKRRRRRRRGKGRSGKTIVTPDIQPMALKALAGTTPQERLRITACLNELASLVASA